MDIVKRYMNKSIYLVLVLFILTAIGVFFLKRSPALPESIGDTEVTSVVTGKETGITSTPEEWETFSDASAGISLQYPPDWQVQETAQSFRNGDLFSILIVGQQQRPQTELYDGARFAVMNPVVTDTETLTWMRENYESEPPIDPERPPQYGNISFGSVQYDTITVCGLGCFTYYHTKQNRKIYGFLMFAEGSDKAVYEQTLEHIMESVEFP